MNTQHTPGPWAVNQGPHPWEMLITPVTGHPVAIARMLDRHHLQAFENGQEIMEANARLIASAPDLLAALKLAAIMHPHNVTFQEAIKRATGEA